MHMSKGTIRRRYLSVLALIAVPPVALLASSPGAVAAGSAPAAAAASAAATVSVNAGQSLATVPSTAIGLNASTYDGDVLDSAVPGLVSKAGVSVMRFPGGTESDQYNWKSNTDVLSGRAQAVSFDQFMSVIGQTQATPMITVNYGTGNTIGKGESPQETGAQVAADWVNYANVQHHYNIKYWEIGNEVYGNDTYNAFWEPDDHCGAIPPASQPSNCGPSVYAQNVKAYIAAMKAVDPAIKVGVVLTAPGNWPDGVTAAGSPQPWNQTVLSALGSSIDFADVHWYPQNPSSVTPPGPTDAGLLADTTQIPNMMSTLRSQFTQYAGSASLPVMLTETNSVSSNPGKQTVSQVNALYLLQDYTAWIENGVANVDWWQLHNGMVTTGDNGSSLYGTQSYGDYGVLSDATCGTVNGSQVCEPSADTPYPAYYGLDLEGQFIHPGDTLVPASSSASLVQSYAAKAADGSLRVLLVNDDPSNTYNVSLNYSGFTPSSATPSVATLAPPGSGITTASQGSAGSETLAPYTAELITLQPGGNVAPPTTPGTPTASGVTSTSASLSWAASTSAAGIAGYNVVEINGTTQSVVATPTTNSATITGLSPGTSYTFAVYAKDTAGTLSARSGTVTVTTTSTSSASCAVSYQANDWGTGLSASVAITNTGTSAVNGWTLAFTWPGNQHITQGWSATWSQAGSQVTATSLSWDASIAPSATVTIGFNASYSGSDPRPAGFTLNGAACTSK
jgi:hypothetical protein